MTKVQALLGIIHAPTTASGTECQCHDEYMLAKRASGGNAKDTGSTRTHIKGWSINQVQVYERYFGDVAYLHGTLRDVVER